MGTTLNGQAAFVPTANMFASVPRGCEDGVWVFMKVSNSALTIFPNAKALVKGLLATARALEDTGEGNEPAKAEWYADSGQDLDGVQKAYLAWDNCDFWNYTDGPGRDGQFTLPGPLTLRVRFDDGGEEVHQWHLGFLATSDVLRG